MTFAVHANLVYEGSGSVPQFGRGFVAPSRYHQQSAGSCSQPGPSNGGGRHSRHPNHSGSSTSPDRSCRCSRTCRSWNHLKFQDCVLAAGLAVSWETVVNAVASDVPPPTPWPEEAKKFLSTNHAETFPLILDTCVRARAVRNKNEICGQMISAHSVFCETIIAISFFLIFIIQSFGLLTMQCWACWDAKCHTGINHRSLVMEPISKFLPLG